MARAHLQPLWRIRWRSGRRGGPPGLLPAHRPFARIRLKARRKPAVPHHGRRADALLALPALLRQPLAEQQLRPGHACTRRAAAAAPERDPAAAAAAAALALACLLGRPDPLLVALQGLWGAAWRGAACAASPWRVFLSSGGVPLGHVAWPNARCTHVRPWRHRLRALAATQGLPGIAPPTCARLKVLLPFSLSTEPGAVGSVEQGPLVQPVKACSVAVAGPYGKHQFGDARTHTRSP